MRPKKHSLGIALGGGGPSGVVYEIGALRALEEAIEGFDATAAQSYVGVSAGAFVASALANGITPARQLRMLFRDVPGEQPFVPKNFFRPAYGEWFRRGRAFPKLFLSALWSLATQKHDENPFDHFMRIGQALPTGVFDNEPIRRYIQGLFSVNGRTDDFRELARRGRRLTVVATEIEYARVAPFGREGLDDVPISRAVQASTAVPGLYLPVAINGRHYVDGALTKTVHSSIPCEDGARLVFVLNPLVPVVVPAPGAILEEGLPATMHQTVRMMLHSRLNVSLGAMRRRFPHTDVVLLEPRAQDHALFFGESFSFASREAVCDAAYQITRGQLYAQRRTIAPTLRKHGMRLRVDVLEDDRRDLWTGVGLRRTVRTAPVALALERALDEVERLAG